MTISSRSKKNCKIQSEGYFGVEMEFVKEMPELGAILFKAVNYDPKFRRCEYILYSSRTGNDALNLSYIDLEELADEEE